MPTVTPTLSDSLLVNGLEWETIHPKKLAHAISHPPKSLVKFGMVDFSTLQKCHIDGGKIFGPEFSELVKNEVRSLIERHACRVFSIEVNRAAGEKYFYAQQTHCSFFCLTGISRLRSRHS